MLPCWYRVRQLFPSYPSLPQSGSHIRVPSQVSSIPPRSLHLPNDRSGSPCITQHLWTQVNAGSTTLGALFHMPAESLEHTLRRVPCIAGGSLLLREGPRWGQGSSTHVAAASGRGHAAEEGEADSKGTNCLTCKYWGSPGLLPRLLGLIGGEPGPTTSLKHLSCFWSTGVTCCPALGRAMCSAGPSTPILSASCRQQGHRGKHCPGLRPTQFLPKICSTALGEPF